MFSFSAPLRAEAKLARTPVFLLCGVCFSVHPLRALPFNVLGFVGLCSDLLLILGSRFVPHVWETLTPVLHGSSGLGLSGHF